MVGDRPGSVTGEKTEIALSSQRNLRDYAQKKPKAICEFMALTYQEALPKVISAFLLKNTVHLAIVRRPVLQQLESTIERLENKSPPK